MPDTKKTTKYSTLGNFQIQSITISLLFAMAFFGSFYCNSRADSVLLAGAESNVVESDNRLVSIARELLEAPYAAGTMIGDPDIPEQLVCRSDSLDCMCYLDIILAKFMTPGSESDTALFCSALIKQRYFGAQISYQNRHHFFTDWIESGPLLIDAGGSFAGAKLTPVDINCRQNGSVWLKGIECKQRDVFHVPAKESTLSDLEAGDLVGFWTGIPGLDVTHVGLIDIVEDEVILLHASSKSLQVVAEPLKNHPAWKNGLIVLRLNKAPK
jgi:hypothetical protein